MEKTFQEYTRFINEIVTEEIIKKNIAKIGTVGHFVIAEDGTFKTRFYPGFTLITPTYSDDADNLSLYKTLVEVRDTIVKQISSLKCVKAPDSALHMTVARLISGELFEKSILNIRENEVLDALETVFSKSQAEPGMKFQIEGISILPQGIIAAMVTAEDESGYNQLQSLRDSIYSDKVLSEIGIERKRGFTGHITLMYIEKELTAKEKKDIVESLIQVNGFYFLNPHPFYLNRAEVRRFDNYLDFYREEDWPLIAFKQQEL